MVCKEKLGKSVHGHTYSRGAHTYRARGPVVVFRIQEASSPCIDCRCRHRRAASDVPVHSQPKFYTKWQRTVTSTFSFDIFSYFFYFFFILRYEVIESYWDIRNLFLFSVSLELLWAMHIKLKKAFTFPIFYKFRFIPGFYYSI